jgi:DNA-binding transcriptional LysR family regulator
MPTRFDFTDLLLVTKIAESKSLSQGAHKAHLSTPAASHRIKLLEENLGVQLLYRKSQGVTLTPSGEAFAHHARTVLQQLEHLNSDIREYARGTKGHLRVWAATMAFEFLPEVVEIFLATRHDVDIEVRERKSFDIVRAIIHGRTDVGIVSATVDSEYVQMIPYREERLVLVTPAQHEFARERSIAFEQALGLPFVGLWEANNIHTFLVQEASRLGATIRLRVEASNFETACRMIEANVGVGVLPEKAAQRYARSFDVAIVELADEWALRKLKICMRKFDDVSPLAQDFAKLLRSNAQAPSGRHESKDVDSEHRRRRA